MILDSNNNPISNEILKDKEYIPCVFKSGLEAKKGGNNNGIYQDRKELHDKEQPKHNGNRRRKT